MSGRQPHPAAEQALRDMLLAVTWRGFTPEAQAEVLAIHRGACAAPGADPREVADDITLLLVGVLVGLLGGEAGHPLRYPAGRGL